MIRFAISLLALLLLAVAADAFPEAREIARFPAAEARQGAAVSSDSIYAVDNHAIGRYDKRTGAPLARWDGGADGPWIHLNSCKLHGAELVCAHSNHSGVPMASSVERFDALTLEPAGSHSFGIFAGSLTWLDRKDGRWWAGFAHYDGNGGVPGRGHEWSEIVMFDDDFRRIGGYTLPPAVLDRLKPHSTSGGAFGPDGLLYVSGHDRPEVYVLQQPVAGSVMRHVATIEVPFAGQAFSLENTSEGLILYGIDRKNRDLLVITLPANRLAGPE